MRCQLRSALGADCPSDHVIDPQPMYNVTLDTILARAKVREVNNIQLRPQRAKITNLRIGNCIFYFLKEKKIIFILRSLFRPVVQHFASV